MTDYTKKALERVRCRALRSRFMPAQEAALYIQEGMNIGCSGFTSAGYPKVVPLAIAERARMGRPRNLTLWTGASVDPELDGALSDAGAISRRFPYQTGAAINDAINSGRVSFQDMHLSLTPQNLRYGFFGKMDVAIIEVSAITEEGHLVPTTSVGNSPSFVSYADKVIVEVNVAQSPHLEGIHDVFIPREPPFRKPFYILDVNDRIGTPYIECPRDKILAIVPCNIPDNIKPMTPQNDTSRAMANNLLDFLDLEVKAGRLPPDLLPIQAGVGNVSNSVLAGLEKWPSDGLRVFTEVIQESMLELLEKGKIAALSGTAFTSSPQEARDFDRRIEKIQKHVVLRSQEISNHPEVIRRLGLLALNTAVEVDAYGHVNSTMVRGSRMINGIGGSGDFARNAFLSVFLCPSTTKGGAISRVVPFCSHVDHTEHDVDVIVTEHGIADLRGLCPRERSREILKRCIHPDYRDQLSRYLKRAELRGGHEPHDLETAFSWHRAFEQNGTMKL